MRHRTQQATADLFGVATLHSSAVLPGPGRLTPVSVAVAEGCTPRGTTIDWLPSVKRCGLRETLDQIAAARDRAVKLADEAQDAGNDGEAAGYRSAALLLADDLMAFAECQP